MADIFALFDKIKSQSTVQKKPITAIVVGLGNPGEQYENTRHNMGFMALDTLAEKYQIRVNNSRFHALCGEGMIGDTGVLLMKPETYMNESGVAVGEAMRFYKVPAQNIFVLCDDINFPVGRMRIRMNGSAGGHNGLKSIIAHVGGDNFPRIKIGVGEKPNPEMDLADWVLGHFSKEDREKAKVVFQNVAEAIPMLLNGEGDLAKNRYST